jgi:hypothetical protein
MIIEGRILSNRGYCVCTPILEWNCDFALVFSTWWFYPCFSKLNTRFAPILFRTLNDIKVRMKKRFAHDYVSSFWVLCECTPILKTTDSIFIGLNRFFWSKLTHFFILSKEEKFNKLLLKYYLVAIISTSVLWSAGLHLLELQASTAALEPLPYAILHSPPSVLPLVCEPSYEH